MHYSLMGKMRLVFIDSDLLYRGVLLDKFDCIFLLQSVIKKSRNFVYYEINFNNS